MDQPPHEKFTTSMKQEFVDHATRTDQVETTAQIVGVNRAEDSYKKVCIIILFYFATDPFFPIANSTKFSA